MIGGGLIVNDLVLRVLCKNIGFDLGIEDYPVLNLIVFGKYFFRGVVNLELNPHPTAMLKRLIHWALYSSLRVEHMLYSYIIVQLILIV